MFNHTTLYKYSVLSIFLDLISNGSRHLRRQGALFLHLKCSFASPCVPCRYNVLARDFVQYSASYEMHFNQRLQCILQYVPERLEKNNSWAWDKKDRANLEEISKKKSYIIFTFVYRPTFKWNMVRHYKVCLRAKK